VVPPERVARRRSGAPARRTSARRQGEKAGGPDRVWPGKCASRGLVRGGALPDGRRWPIKEGSHRFVALATWLPDQTLTKNCADFSDLEIGPDGHLYLLSDKSATIARLDDLPAGGGTAALLDVWRIGDLDGKPEGLAFNSTGHAIVGLDTRKPRRNLILLEPAIAQVRGRGRKV